jgi:hypothetical protein
MQHWFPKVNALNCVSQHPAGKPARNQNNEKTENFWKVRRPAKLFPSLKVNNWV